MSGKIRPWDRPRTGGFGLYAIMSLLLLGMLVIGFFFPQYFRMRSGIYRISCKEIRHKIEVAVSNHDANNTRSIVKPGKPIDLDMLKASGFLGDIQYCPEAGKYLFGPQGEVLCTSHRPTPGSEPNPTEVAPGSPDGSP